MNQRITKLNVNKTEVVGVNEEGIVLVLFTLGDERSAKLSEHLW
jgi:hypothetical protein